MKHDIEDRDRSEKGAEGEPGAFDLQSDQEYLGFQKVEVTKIDETKPWKPALEVRVTKSDGQVVEGLPASTPFFTFTAKAEGGKNLTVSAAVAGHVDQLHIKGEEPGSHFDYESLAELFNDAKDKVPAEVAQTPAVSAFDVDMGRLMGKEGIAELDELIAEGLMTEADRETAMSVKGEVYELNKSGTPEAKQVFIDTFKAAHPESKVQFQLVRGTVLVPTVDAPKRPTTKLFMVFGPDETGENKTLYTMAPGRNMPRHPNPDQHKNREGVIDEQTFKESADAWFNTVMLTGK